MERNEDFEFAWKFIEDTGTNLFLTGKAGTGKTTFLKELRRECPKRMVVLAPTGIAAINAGGMTIHSFFQLSFAPFVPETSFAGDRRSKFNYKIGKEKIRLIRSLDLVVIDEISMVRADLLDEMDGVLRKYRDRSKPFGGVQLLLIGDMQQLSPVVRDEEWQMLRNYYETPYFFSSKALKSTKICTVEFQKVYRQKSGEFLDLLNNIREKRNLDATIDRLNTRYIPDFTPPATEHWIRLVTHNAQAQRINADELGRLPGNKYTFSASVEGKFPEYSFPTDDVLELKKGSQVMFVKNDPSKEKRYFNGMIGEVTEAREDHIEVVSSRDGSVIELQKEEWSNAKYVLDEETKEIREEIEGTFRQYPVKLAWAITVHKSQGLTFDRAIIDAQYAFAHGQTYVALSRCSTLEGLVLSRPLTKGAIIHDPTVDDFMARTRRPEMSEFEAMKREYFLMCLDELFDFSEVKYAAARYVYAAQDYLAGAYPREVGRYNEAQLKCSTAIVDVAAKFRPQYTRLVMGPSLFDSDATLQERVRSAAVYFAGQVLEMSAVFAAALTSSDNKEGSKRLKRTQEELCIQLGVKLKVLKYVGTEGFTAAGYMKQKGLAFAQTHEESPGRRKKQTSRSAKESSAGGNVPASAMDILNPELFKELVAWRLENARAQNIPAYCVMNQKALIGVVNARPQTKAELLQVPYIGQKFIDKYGDEILRIVSESKQ